ncbi:MAG: NUDIX domain-containing protein [Prevotellaceae bacterium]|jgi:8-oxo-dGTP pyrophosphatase MutT (NUDIX family)|nr:NUDIX domain-containing protein [Prevotellaceae bacterium]
MDTLLIYADERFFALSSDESLCFRALNGIGTRIDEAAEVCAHFDFFMQSDIPEFYVCTPTPSAALDCLLSRNVHVAAAGGLLFDAAGRLTLIRRFGYWDLPKGKVEDGETEVEAARREMEEECGIAGVEVGCKIRDTYHVYVRNDVRIIKRTAWFEALYGGAAPFAPQAEEGISEAVSVRLAELQDYIPQTYASLRELMRDAANGCSTRDRDTR